MSRGINKVTLLGHLGKDPEIRSTAGGTIVATVSLATSERRKAGNGDWEDHTEWHNLVMFNKTAEVCRDYLRKGSQCIIEGRIQTRSWDDKDTGAKRYRTEIVVNEMIMLGQPETQNGAHAGGGYNRGVSQPVNTPAYAGPPQSSAYAAPTSAGYPAQDDELLITDDDIPF